MARTLNVLTVFVLIPLINSSTHKECVQKSPCLCEFDDYSKIDLTKLLEGLPTNSTEFPLQDAISGRSGATFGFNGCTDKRFDKFDPKTADPSGKDKATLVVQHLVIVNVTVNDTYIQRNYTQTDILGTSAEIKFEHLTDTHGYELTFKDGNNVRAAIRLTCDQDVHPSFIKVLSNTSTTVNLDLVSSHACIFTESPGLSTGSILIILLIVALLVYFLGGGLILYFMRGARGIELVPNIDFWRDLPALVRDGIIFLFSGCNSNAISTPETYDRI